MAEWLGRGLQNLVHGFNSRRCLQASSLARYGGMQWTGTRSLNRADAQSLEKDKTVYLFGSTPVGASRLF